MTTTESRQYVHKTKEFRVTYGFFGNQHFDRSQVTCELDMDARDGWELVSFCPVTGFKWGRTECFLAILRRPANPN